MASSSESSQQRHKAGQQIDCVTVLGDIVASRQAPDRLDVHRQVVAALDGANEQVATRQSLNVPAGDEFQGSFTTLGQALQAVVLIRARLQTSIDVRFGIGRGPVEVLDNDTGVQDGPGWWAARAAIERVEQQQASTGWTHMRTAYEEHEPDDDRVAAVRSALACQDLVLGSLDDSSWTIVRGLMEGQSQTIIAEQLGITRQAVQQRRDRSQLPLLLWSIKQLQNLS